VAHDGHLLIHGPETMLYPGCEEHLSKSAASTFDLKPEHIFIARLKKGITKSSAVEVLHHYTNKNDVIEEVVQLLQQKIKHVAKTGLTKPFTKKSPGELVISKGFLKTITGDDKMAVLDILRQNDLQAVESCTHVGNDNKEKIPVAFTCVVHYIAIMINAKSGKLNINKLVTVIDAGQIVDLAMMATHLKNALKCEFKNILSACLIARELGIEHSGVRESAVNSILGEMPAIEIIFINPKETNDKRPIADINVLTEIYLDCFSNALHNAIEDATGKQYSNESVAGKKLVINADNNYTLAKRVPAL